MKCSGMTMLILLSSATLFAQAPDTMWTKIYRADTSQGSSVQQTIDGGYIVSGNTNPFSNYADIWLLKTDAYGDTLWTKYFGGNGGDYSRSVRQTTDGGFIIVGFTDSYGAGDYDVWLIKTDNMGDTLWTKTFGGTDRESANSIQQTTDGGYILVGSTDSYGAGGSDVWLIKTDNMGDTLWTKTFGGTNSESANSIQQTTDGGYILVGSTKSYGAGISDAWLVRTDVNGNIIWQKTYGTSDHERGVSVAQTTDNGFITTGLYRRDLWIIKTNILGNTLWTKTMSRGDYDFQGNSVKQTEDGGYIIAIGRNGFGDRSDAWLIKTDFNGDTVWTKSFGDTLNNVFYEVQQTFDGGYIVIGSHNLNLSSVNSLSTSLWLIKVAPEVTSIDPNSKAKLEEYQLLQNYPNPFNPTTTIGFSVPQSNFVTLKVYNILGEEVATLISEKLVAGSYKYNWDAYSLASGVYLYRIQAGDYVESKKMILLR